MSRPSEVKIHTVFRVETANKNGMIDRDYVARRDCGLGDKRHQLALYIGNRPPLPEYESLESLRPLSAGELTSIVERTGNHWRKIFNLYAKLVYELGENSLESWQAYRDSTLLTNGSGVALLFSPPRFDSVDRVHVISGRAYASRLGADAEWLDSDFAVDRDRKLVIAPYFDYRQLSNRKLAQLVCIINGLTGQVM